MRFHFRSSGMMKIRGPTVSGQAVRKTSPAPGKGIKSENPILAKALILLGFSALFGLLRKPFIDYNTSYFSAPVLDLILREQQSFLRDKN
jgi:hypothetical protein